MYLCMYVARRRRSSFNGENSAEVLKALPSKDSSKAAPTSNYDNNRRRSTIDGSSINLEEKEKKTAALGIGD